MSWLLDTNACIDYLKRGTPAIRERLRATRPGDVYLCSIVKSELLYGAYKSQDPERTCASSGPFSVAFHPWNSTTGAPSCPAAVISSVRSCRSFWRTNQQVLGHYFRYLYRVFKFIDEEEVNDKHRYSGIARAPLSDLELLLLYYNCLMPQSERFKPLAEKYALFDSLPIDLLLDKRHLAFVDPMAWGGQEGAVRKRFEHLSMSRISVDSEA